MKTTKLIPAALLTIGMVSALLAGCGGSPTGTSSKVKRSSLQGSAPLVQAPQPGQAGMPPGGGDATALLMAVSQAQAAQNGFTATVDTYEKGPKGTDTQTLKVAFKRPQTLKIHIVKGAGQSNDAKVLWTGGNDIKVKPSFLPFAVSKSISDEALKTYNGWTIKDTCPNAILDQLMDTSAQKTIIGEQALVGKQLIMVKVISGKRPKGSTHEIHGIDKATMLPAFREVYKDQAVMYRLTMKVFKSGTPSESELSL